MDLRTKVDLALKNTCSTMSLQAFDTLVSCGLLRDADESIPHLLNIIKEQQELIEQLIKDADKHD